MRPKTANRHVLLLLLACVCMPPLIQHRHQLCHSNLQRRLQEAEALARPPHVLPIECSCVCDMSRLTAFDREFLSDKLLFTTAVDAEAKAVLTAKNTGACLCKA